LPWDVEPEVFRFGKRVEDVLNDSSNLEEAIKEANIDLELEIVDDDESWVVSVYGEEPLTRPVRDCYQIIAELLLAMPIP